MDIKSFALGYNAGASKSGGNISQAELEAAIKAVVPEWALEENPPKVDADPAGTAQTLVDDLASQTARDLANFYTKDQTLTKDEINALVSAIPKFSIEVVTSLPASNISETTVYLVKSGDDDTNLYTEYIYKNDKWEKLGTQTVDLTGYATEAWVNDVLAAYVKTVDMEAYVTGLLAGYLTPTTGDQRYAKKSDIPTVPQTLPNPYALNILGKTYNGASAVSLTVEEIMEAIKTASGGVVVYLDGNKLVMTGNLPDATYTAYYEVDGELVEIGDLALGSVTPDPVTYTIRWVNYDGTVLKTNTVTEGGIPTYDGDTPTRAADGEYTYTFAGWTPEVVAATADATYTATYTQTAKPVEPAEPKNFAEYNATNTAEGDTTIWVNQSRINSGGSVVEETSTTYGVAVVSNFIPVQNGDVVYYEGFYTAASSSLLCNGNKERVKSGALKTLNTGGYIADLTESTSGNRTGNFTISNADVEYVRLGGFVRTTDTPVIKIQRNGEYLTA